MHVARALLLPALLSLAGPASAEEPRVIPGIGFAWFEQGGPRARQLDASGLALELRVDGRAAPRVGYDVTLTWGLTDWDRARKWIDAGNDAAGWTTDRLADVDAWVRKNRTERDKQAKGLRLLGAIFADVFLALTYVALPACYVGSVGGATSHLQLDVTGSVHLSDGPSDAWLELGAGAAALPRLFLDWNRAFGPIFGVGMQAGPLRVGGRVLWSPPALNTATHGGTVLTGALTVGLVR